MFESCSAYQNSRPHVLFLSHCVPNPPDKGEKIRANYELKALCERFQVHLACFARTRAEIADAQALSSLCSTVCAVPLPFTKTLVTAGAKFALGACLNKAFYENARLERYIRVLSCRVELDGAFVYTAVMSPYVPEGIPRLLDIVDVDSDKWFQYARARFPGGLYQLEGCRMRQFEADCAAKARTVIATTINETALLSSYVQHESIIAVENGVDAEYFDGIDRPLSDLEQQRFLVFVGTMDYQPNIAGVVWFVHEVFPALQQRIPDLKFFVVGRNPTRKVKALEGHAGVRVIGAVPDVRPYLAQARAVVAPLQLARGIQNKVLEALAMGRRVFASDAVCRTFGDSLPQGVVHCRSTEAYVDRLQRVAMEEPTFDPHVREAAIHRFSWQHNMRHIVKRMSTLCARVDDSVSLSGC